MFRFFAQTPKINFHDFHGLFTAFSGFFTAFSRFFTRDVPVCYYVFLFGVLLVGCLWFCLAVFSCIFVPALFFFCWGGFAFRVFRAFSWPFRGLFVVFRGRFFVAFSCFCFFRAFDLNVTLLLFFWTNGKCTDKKLPARRGSYHFSLQVRKHFTLLTFWF